MEAVHLPRVLQCNGALAAWKNSARSRLAKLSTEMIASGIGARIILWKVSMMVFMSFTLHLNMRNGKPTRIARKSSVKLIMTRSLPQATLLPAAASAPAGKKLALSDSLRAGLVTNHAMSPEAVEALMAEHSLN
eukprot:scaffold17426_cov58-Attheya_sp.AAC.5